jgi:hypothetical protein
MNLQSADWEQDVDRGVGESQDEGTQEVCQAPDNEARRVRSVGGRLPSVKVRDAKMDGWMRKSK